MKRHALFVGVDRYNDDSIRDLRFSVPDASVLSDRFKRFGYTTRLLANPTQEELLNAVDRSVEGLGGGDVFLFFFAGHGFTAQDGAHLLFCRDHKHRLLRVNAAGVRVDALEELTSRGGFHRAFFLDSCRTDCFAGVEERGGGTRDLDFVRVPECTVETGSFYLLRSCEKFRPSLEIEALGHGLFTQGLLDAMDVRDGRLVGCDTSFAAAVGFKMADIQRNHNVDCIQRPSIGECSGPVFSLFDAGFSGSAASAVTDSYAPASTPSGAYVVCPECGKYNMITETFKCKTCGRDHLCLEHFSTGCNCCSNCMKSLRNKHEKGVDCFRGQNGEEVDFAKAAGFFHEAAVAGYARSQCSLGKMYADGLGVQQDDVVAVKWYRKAAEQEHVGAQNSLGFMYKEGRGVRQDDVEAVKWYRQAAEQGDARAQNNLAEMYEEGRGVRQDFSAAANWCRKAAAQDFFLAKGKLKRLQCREAAEQGDATAQYNLGRLYFTGEGVQRDSAEGVKWYRKAAEQGNADAQFALGFSCYVGDGVERDAGEAIKWFLRLAEQGNADAQYHLGEIYYDGWGVEKDLAEAVRWFRKAAEQGHAHATYLIGRVYYDSEGDMQDVAEAVRWFRKAAEQGDEWAQCHLGFMYENGQNVRQNESESVKWYRKAAEQGRVEAQLKMGEYEYDDGNNIEALNWYLAAAAQENEDAYEELKRILEEFYETDDGFDEVTDWISGFSAEKDAEEVEILERLKDEIGIGQANRSAGDENDSRNRIKGVQLWEGGPYWADRNIGAENPRDSGYYFWWGDTIGYKRVNDKWVASDGSSCNFSFVEENVSTDGKDDSELQSEGLTDEDSVLSLEHDAAKQHWVGNWRMPTRQELEELEEKCDWTWTTINGVSGYIVRGRGDYASASIFLPAVGYGEWDSLDDVGSFGCYWSSVLDFAGNAWSLCFRQDCYGTDCRFCTYGQSVRAVQGAPNSERT